MEPVSSAVYLSLCSLCRTNRELIFWSHSTI